MHIREAVREDMDQLDKLYSQVDELHRQAYPGRFRKPEIAGRPEAYYLERIQAQDALLLVAELDGQVIGFAEGYLRSAPDIPVLQQRSWLMIDSVAVDQNHRGHGAGKALFDGLEARANKRGITEIELNVYAFNQKAIGFYEKLGFEVISQTMGKGKGAAYPFDKMVSDLRIGREIEFAYGGRNYSISQNAEGWQFCCDNVLLTQVHEDVEFLIRELTTDVSIEGLGLPAIFDQTLYQSSSLYIL